jgi:pimeloyl-[acyl-carrier protein] synthase
VRWESWYQLAGESPVWPKSSRQARSKSCGQQVVDQLLDRVVQADRQFDLIGDFAYPLPVQVICALLGVPEEGCEPLRLWSAGVTRSLDAVVSRDPQLIRGGDAGAAGLTDYVRRLVALRRAEPPDDLLSGLIAARDGGDRLSEDELLATCVMLFFGGHETTVNLIGNGTLALLRHPDQLERLRADLSLIPSAVEELLRYDSPVQRVGLRIARENIDLGDVLIRPGEAATGFIGAANRDPDQFSDCEELDLGRSNNRHLSFAAGAHYCLGAALARLEAQLAFASLVTRMPELRRLTDTPDWRHTPTLRGLQSLPLGF